jgi:EAL domain-containing protein (putative c-di-GMP-specific phosphodiesterase class I)
VQLGRAHGLRILGAVAKPFTLGSLKVLLDRARSLAKPRGLSSCAPLTPDEIRAGLQGDAVELVYQPKFSARTGTLAGVEALLRWRHGDGSLAYPAAVIPVAESEGLINDITEAVLRRALAQCGAWQSEGYDIAVAVNVSMQDLHRYDFPEFVVETASNSGVDPTSVVLEITESQIMADIVRPLEVLSRLRLKGVGLSIDDYGTGASSMQQLRRIPFTELKIDREFVAGAPEDAAARAMLMSSIALGKDLGLSVVAEGVETQAEWRLVASRGVDVVQGYFVARPMVAGDIEGWFGRWGNTAN